MMENRAPPKEWPVELCLITAKGSRNGPEETTFLEQGFRQHIDTITVNE